MSKKINSFSEYVNEASLRGNIGIPGEEGSGRESWLDKITARSNPAAQAFAMEHRRDINDFMSGTLIQRSMELQRDHEQELSDLTIDSFRTLFGYLLEDKELDFKIVTNPDIKQKMEKTPTEQSEIPDLEEIEDESIINQVHKRKILRTIQQGKGLSAKAILNLSLFKKGLVEIMGEQAAAEYLTVLNKICNVAQFFDWTVPEEQQKAMWQTRSGFSGSCELEFPEEQKEEEKEDIAQKVLDDLAAGDDITDNPDVEELVSGLAVRIVVRGVDLSVLIHEGVKGVYKLVTQASLEALYGGTAETVLMNTDTLFDELQEIKFGRQMQDAFFKPVAEHPEVSARINEMIRNNAEDWEISSFQIKLDYLFFNEIAQLGQDDATEMLDLVNAILSESLEAKELCDPLIRKAIQSIDQDEEYRAWKQSKLSTSVKTKEEPEFELPQTRRESSMSRDEIADAIIDAYEKGDMVKVAELEKLLK